MRVSNVEYLQIKLRNDYLFLKGCSNYCYKVKYSQELGKLFAIEYGYVDGYSQKYESKLILWGKTLSSLDEKFYRASGISPYEIQTFVANQVVQMKNHGLFDNKEELYSYAMGIEEEMKRQYAQRAAIEKNRMEQEQRRRQQEAEMERELEAKGLSSEFSLYDVIRKMGKG